jgi:hypothetical protein
MNGVINASQGFGLATEGCRIQMIGHHLSKDISHDR